MCLLSRSLYDLRQVPCLWFNRFVAHAISIRFKQSRSDSSLFVYRNGNTMSYLLLYVDDMILSTSTRELLQHFILNLKSTFAVKDMGHVHYFLGVDVKRTPDGFILS
jgi:hypothetical protein